MPRVVAAAGDAFIGGSDGCRKQEGTDTFATISYATSFTAVRLESWKMWHHSSGKNKDNDRTSYSNMPKQSKPSSGHKANI